MERDAPDYESDRELSPDLRHKIQHVTVKTSAKPCPIMPLIRPMTTDCATGTHSQDSAGL